MSFEHARDLTDPFKDAPGRVLEKSKANVGGQPATVLVYDDRTNTALVKVHNAGPYPIRLPIKTSYQGPEPGTGRAVQLWPGQLVHVHFENGQAAGLRARGYIDLAYFTSDDHGAPQATSWATNPTGTVEVYPGVDGRLGDTEHIDAKSNRHQVKIGEHNLDDWSSTSTAVIGPNELLSAKKTKESAKKAGEAADRLMGKRR